MSKDEVKNLVSDITVKLGEKRLRTFVSGDTFLIYMIAFDFT